MPATGRQRQGLHQEHGGPEVKLAERDRVGGGRGAGGGGGEQGRAEWAAGGGNVAAAGRRGGGVVLHGAVVADVAGGLEGGIAA